MAKTRPRVRPLGTRPVGFLGDIMEIRTPAELVEDLACRIAPELRSTG
jgi:hypothetical protein